MRGIYLRSIGALAATIAICGPAHGALVINAIETGGDIVFSTEAGGSLDLSGLSIWLADVGPQSAFVDPLIGEWGVGGPGSFIDIYSGVSGPSSIGTGGSSIAASSGSGDFIGGDPSFVIVPFDYVSGGLLSATSTFSGQTFASLSLSEGTYIYNLPSDTMTLNIGAVPIPAAVWLFASALGLLGWMRRKAA